VRGKYWSKESEKGRRRGKYRDRISSSATKDVSEGAYLKVRSQEGMKDLQTFQCDEENWKGT